MTTMTMYALCTSISNSITNIPLYGNHFHVMYEADRVILHNHNEYIHEHVQYMEYLEFINVIEH